MNKYRVIISTDKQQHEEFNRVYEINSPIDPVWDTLLKPDSNFMKDLSLYHINYLDPDLRIDVYLESPIELEDPQTNIFNTIQENLVHDMDFDSIIDQIFESLNENGININRTYDIIPESLKKAILKKLEALLL